MVTAELITIETNENDSIVIFVCFSKDGEEVVWLDRYGNPVTRNGRNVWGLLSGIQNYLAKTEQERLTWIRVNVEAQMRNIIVRSARQALNDALIQSLSPYIGTIIQKDSVTLDIDINGTGETRTITIKDDGTYTVG